MSNLRILVKRNGEPVAQRKEECFCHNGQWRDEPEIPIVHEPEEEKCVCKSARPGFPVLAHFNNHDFKCATCGDFLPPKPSEPEKSFGQVVYDALIETVTMAYPERYDKIAQVVIDEAKKRGWREPV